MCYFGLGVGIRCLGLFRGVEAVSGCGMVLVMDFVRVGLYVGHVGGFVRQGVCWGLGFCCVCWGRCSWVLSLLFLWGFV